MEIVLSFVFVGLAILSALTAIIFVIRRLKKKQRKDIYFALAFTSATGMFSVLASYFSSLV